MRVQKIKTVEEIQTGLVQGVRKLSPFLINTAMAPKKGMQKSLPYFVTALYSSNWKTRKGNAGCQKVSPFYTETRRILVFLSISALFFVRVVVLKLYTIIT